MRQYLIMLAVFVAGCVCHRAMSKTSRHQPADRYPVSVVVQQPDGIKTTTRLMEVRRIQDGEVVIDQPTPGPGDPDWHLTLNMADGRRVHLYGPPITAR